VSEEKDKPVFDEQLLTNLLEAAYVLQEHNRELQSMELHVEPQDLAAQEPAIHAPADDKAESGATRKDTLTLGQIVETQHQIQVRRLDLESAMALVAERVAEIVHAGGAAIGVLDGRKVRYKAAFGLMALAPGAEVLMEKALCVACLRTGQVIRCLDVNPEFLLDTEECHRRGIQAMIAVPIYHDGGIAGGLEVYYENTQAFTEQDVHTCQLMAGLVTEALARDEELSWKKSLASERAAMMDALAKLKPNLMNLAKGSAGKTAAPRPAPTAPSPSAAAFVCRLCGNELAGGEQFCGKCGAPRGSNYEPLPLPGKVAPINPAAQALRTAELADPVNISPAHQEQWERDAAQSSDTVDSMQEEVAGLLAKAQLQGSTESVEGEITSPLEDMEAGIRILPESNSGTEAPSAEDGKLVKPELGAWTSAASTRAFLEQLSQAPRPGALLRFWNARRGDFYLAIAVLLVACVIRWGIWSDGSVSATGSTGSTATASNRKPAPDADLSLFDRMLINFGLADAPEPQENKGNPDTRVWVDLHTALYYCPAADLYGKTPKGKFTTQREAQLDQFEPAYRKACD
jgi:putative methionine-R-sulfoxide reductase with GAF domain